MAAALCSYGHLHFEPSGGLIEVQALEADQPALAGEPGGRLVATPFAPYRETSIVLRYDTQDVVSVLPEPPRCELAALPATSHLRGKLALSVRQETAGPSPASCSRRSRKWMPFPYRPGTVWSVPGGVGVEVCARSTGPSARRVIGRRARSPRHSAATLVVTDDPGRLERARPMRCDLKELSEPPCAPRNPALIGPGGNRAPVRSGASETWTVPSSSCSDTRR